MTRPRLANALAIAAALLVLGVAWLVAARLAPAPGTGFTERVLPGPQCDGAPREAHAREPFVRETDDSSPRCVEWTANLVLHQKMRAKLETTVSGFASVSIDDRMVLVDDAPGPAHVKDGVVDLAPGVHRFAASYRTRGGRAYMRLAMDDELDPHDFSVVAPLDESAFFVTRADAARALAAPAPAPSTAAALAAALALALAGTLAWLSVRLARGRAIPWADLAIAVGLFAGSLFVRIRDLADQDVCWDEGILSSSEHYVRDVVLGDYASEAWRYNVEHLPLSKYVLAIGDVLGGLDGARTFVGVAGAASVSLVFAFGLMAFGRRIGVVAGALAVFLPLLVAHSRIAGHESFVLFWWCLSMVAFAGWAKRGDGVAAFFSVFAATAGVFSRPTAVWIVPVLLAGWLLFTRGSLRDRARAFPLPAIAGGACALLLVVAIWPAVWADPMDKLRGMTEHWSRTFTDFEVYMGKLRTPQWHYFLVAFVTETPALLLLAAADGLVTRLRADRADRPWGALCLAWLVCPFFQSFSILRIGAGRYVIQAWPALLLFAAIALVTLGDRLALLLFQLPKRARAVVAAAPAIAVTAYVAIALVRVEPYPLDYFDEIVGGPSGVAARKMFEIPWWGEGNLAAVRAINAAASHGARVHLALWPEHTLRRLRDDLVPTRDPAAADYVLVSHLQYFAAPPAGCAPIGRVEVQGAPLVDTYRCNPPSPVQAGFAAMSRGAPDAAVPEFEKALERNPQDAAAVFGMGWATQAKGDLHAAEALYAQAIALAARSGDRDTEYFARYDLGTVYLAQARYADARASLLGAGALRPGDPGVKDMLATVEAKSLASVPSPSPPTAPTSSAPPAAPPRR
jgi:tetratricopeptide (TPR) repeat protein